MSVPDYGFREVAESFRRGLYSPSEPEFLLGIVRGILRRIKNFLLFTYYRTPAVFFLFFVPVLCSSGAYTIWIFGKEWYYTLPENTFSFTPATEQQITFSIVYGLICIALVLAGSGLAVFTPYSFIKGLRLANRFTKVIGLIYGGLVGKVLYTYYKFRVFEPTKSFWAAIITAFLLCLISEFFFRRQDEQTI